MRLAIPPRHGAAAEQGAAAAEQVLPLPELLPHLPSLSPGPGRWVWTCPPGQDWAAWFAGTLGEVAADGRSGLAVVPDGRDLRRLVGLLRRTHRRSGSRRALRPRLAGGPLCPFPGGPAGPGTGRGGDPVGGLRAAADRGRAPALGRRRRQPCRASGAVPARPRSAGDAGAAIIGVRGRRVRPQHERAALVGHRMGARGADSGWARGAQSPRHAWTTAATRVRSSGRPGCRPAPERRFAPRWNGDRCWSRRPTRLCAPAAVRGLRDPGRLPALRRPAGPGCACGDRLRPVRPFGRGLAVPAVRGRALALLVGRQ